MYGLIGKVLKHSYSKEIHEMLGNSDYTLYELDEMSFIEMVKRKEYKGLNITMPYKIKAMNYMDFVSSEAKAIGSINTIVNKAGKLYGYNTDYYGFEYIMELFEISLIGKKVLVLGNGGAAKPVFYYLEKNNVEYYIVKTKADKNVITYEEAREKHSDVDVIINTSPVGMYPNVSFSPISLEGYDNLSLVIDMIANPVETKLMRQARERNLLAIGGLELLVAQAKKSEELFKEKEIDDSQIVDISEEIELLMKNKSRQSKNEYIIEGN